MSVVFIFVFGLGLIVGSFLNVVVLRYGTGLSVVRGRSRCFSCDHVLTVRDLVPLFSYLLSMGRCRYCGSRISLQYPLVELSTAILWTLVIMWYAPLVLNVPTMLSITGLLIFVSLCVAIAVYDLRHKLIPDVFSYTAAGAALVYVVGYMDPMILFWHLVAATGAFLFFYVLWRVSSGTWMGLGDGKLAISTGLLLGPSGALAALLFAFWSGAIISLVIIIVRRLAGAPSTVTMKSEIPFAPFIIVGTLVCLFLRIDMGTIAAVLTI